jgi:hypothetical protein
MARWFLFFLTVCIGIAAGLFYGWVLSPVEYVDTSPDSLSIDYKADYVLMVAEAYQRERDLARAEARLEALGSGPLFATVQQAIRSAEAHDYVETDLALMRQLLDDLLPAGNGPGTATP